MAKDGMVPIYVARISDLSGADFRVLIALASFADTGQRSPSLAMLAGATDIVRHNVPRSLAKLERLGVIEVFRAPNQASHYRIKNGP
jgi:hypothetical protein